MPDTTARFLRRAPRSLCIVHYALSIAALAAVAARAETTDSYVRSGLLACWDGIENAGARLHDPFATNWIDVVGGKSFVLNDVTVADDRIVFKGGMSSYGVLDEAGTTATFGAAANGTLEIVYASATGTGSQVILQSSSGSGILYSFYKASTLIACNASAPTATFTSGTATNTAAVRYTSAKPASYVVNGTELANGGNNYWGGANKTTVIGNRTAHADSHFNGAIYCIRLYDRQLSDAEIAANLAVDRHRFQEGGTPYGTASVAQTNGVWYATASLKSGSGEVSLNVVSPQDATNVVSLSNGSATAPATFTAAISGLAADTIYSVFASFVSGTDTNITRVANTFNGAVTVAATSDATSATPGAFTVSRASTADATWLPLTVNISLSGTAVAGTHYAAIPATVTIPAGAASATVEVRGLSKETASTSLTLALSDGNYVVGDPSSATVSITTTYAHKIVRVAPGGTGDGSSWADAMASVNDAYASAAAFVEGGGASAEVWVKTGRYTISSAITVKSCVSVLGGFLGTETDASQANRDNLTIFSGDLYDDDYWQPCGTNTVEKLYIWTGEDKMTFNPPNMDGRDVYWSNHYGAKADYGYGFQTSALLPPVTNCTFSGLTFTAFYTRPLNTEPGGPHSRIAVTNCNFWACSVNGDCGAYIYADEMTVSDNLCWGGRSGFRLTTTPTRICTNEIARCTFRDIYSRGGMYLTSGLAGTQWRITDCDFFRNRSDSNAWAPSVMFGGNKGGNFYMTRCTIRECRISDRARGLAFCQDGGAGQIHFFTDCDIADNISTNCTDVGCGCFSGSHIGKNWFFRNCSIRNNTTWYTGSGNAASVYVSIGANQYTAFLNCSIVGNRIVKVGGTPAASHGTLSIPLNTTRLAVVNCLLDGNECVGAVTNADIVSCASGNMAMAVVNSVVNGQGENYKAIHTVQRPYLFKSYLAGFDRDNAGCASFERCEDVFSTVDPAICERLRSKAGAPHLIKGLWINSPYWRGGADIYWRDRGTSRPHVVLRDPVFHGGKNPWHPINYGYGENNFSDATAAAEGITVDSPLVPDALDNPRKRGKVAFGPINYAVPTFISVR